MNDRDNIAERNIKRLLGAAYRPEPIDPAFVLETEEKLRAAARSRVCSTHAATILPPPVELLRLRRRLSWAMAAAAAIAAVFLVRHASAPRTARHRSEIAKAAGTNAQAFAWATDGVGLTARPRPEAPKPPILDPGDTLTTRHGERRRVALADGSTLFLNEDTQVMLTAARVLRLHRGGVYLEVAPRTDTERFVVETPQRKFTATGTHFHVAATPAGSGVLVTQGKVKVSDVPAEVFAGQQVKPGSQQPTVAPRATHVLDWLKPLVAAAETPLVPACQHEGGALIAVDPNGHDLQLEMRKHHIDVHIEDGFARTTIDQTYFNNTWSRLEGTFYFPLPPDASLSRLAMYVVDGKDCKLMEGGMAERGEAANAYETIRHERRDPALLEWVDGSTFKMRVFPLEAWQEKRIILSYTQRLPALYGVAKYRFPGGHNMQIVRDWSFAATIKNATDWEVLTPSHPDMQASRDAADILTLRAEAKLVKPEQDVVLELREREAPPGGATFATHLQDGQRYFMVRHRPKLDARPQRQRRDWIIVFEASANRDPLLARTQIDVIRHLLKNVEYEDTLTVMTANTRVQTLSAQPQSATPAHVNAAIAFLERTHLVGGCDLERALRKALEVAATANNPHLLHLGAGVASLGEFKEDVLARLIPERVRYVGVGVGKKWNRSFMKMAAERTGGYYTQINPDEPVAWRAFDLLATLNTPRLLDVRVVDPDEPVAYLATAASLADGEEICALTRGPSDKLALPKRVRITGRLDGLPYRSEIEVGRFGNVPRAGGYLPRTWAKLEIDRLLADGQDKNRAAITELSKAMYVMSPFTSLLVLETEADYKRFNIDRGRKDHWAMYACPERIPLVHEPDPAYRQRWPGVESAQVGQKATVEQVLDTILLRLPPQYIFAHGRQVHWPLVATARQVLLSGYAMPMLEIENETLLERLGDLDRKKWNRTYAINERRAGAHSSLGRLRLSEMDGLMRGGDVMSLHLLPMERREAEGVVDLAESLRRSSRGLSPLTARLGDLDFKSNPEMGRFLSRGASRASEDFGVRSMFLATRELGSDLFGRTSPRPTKSSPYAGVDMMRNQGSRRLFESLLGEELAERMATKAHGVDGEMTALAMSPATSTRLSPADLMLPSLDGVELSQPMRSALAEIWTRRLAGQLQTRQAASWLTYHRPGYQVDQRLFGDLTIHAPGLNATWADIQYTIAEEAHDAPRQAPGKIDDAARKLFAQARRDAWSSVTFPGVGRRPGMKFQANGQGKFTYQRMLASGLVETVVGDGATLWHLYPEIGLGTRRPFSRFHFEELSGWAPWVLPPIEDLAIGADLKALDERTVAIVPHDRAASAASNSTREKKDEPRQLHIVFAVDGSLAEFRIVNASSNQVHTRQVFHSDGSMRWLDGDGKLLAERKCDRQPLAVAPSVRPSLDELVILDMPLRTTGYWDRRVDKLRAEAVAKNDEAWATPAYLGLFAAACFSHDRDVLPIFAARFHAKGDKRLGFYTLLSARDARFLDQPNTSAPGIATFQPEIEHPGSPLARYLVHHQKNLRIAHEADVKFLENLPGPSDGFVARLAAFRNAWNAWRHHHLVGRDPSVHEREKRKLMDFAHVNTSPVIAFLLQSNMQHLNSHDRADLAKLLYETQKDNLDPDGLGYVFGYDAAYHLYYKGERQQAARLFRELHQQALARGVLPKIDSVFRDALDDPGSGGPNFGVYLRSVVHEFLKKDQPHFALMVALQASQVGSQTLGDELFQHILQRQQTELASRTAPVLVLLASLEYVVHNHLDARADALRDQLLADKDLARQPGVWRLSTALAQQRGQGSRAVADLEKALDLEYQRLADVVNLESVRRDYRDLLGRFLEIAKAAQTLEREPPNDLADRVVRAADRWRSLDSEAREVCQKAAAILKRMGAKDMAWDYLTTPLALKPNEAVSWTDLAQFLRGDGDLEAADRAFARAFQCEATNPQILWDRSQNLLQLGRTNEARELWRQIAAGNWQPRFQALVPQARWHLEH